MIHPNTIALLGGSGKAGKFLVEALTRRGFCIKMLLRDPPRYESFKRESIEIIKGDARDYDSIARLISNCDAVISALGQPKGECPIFSTATKNIVQAMIKGNVKRYILIAGLNVDAPGDEKGAYARAATEWMKNNYPDAKVDRQRELDLLSDSDVDWTLVRVPLIEVTNATSRLLVNIADCPGEKIFACDLADFLADQIDDKTYVRQSPFIASTDRPVSGKEPIPEGSI